MKENGTFVSEGCYINGSFLSSTYFRITVLISHALLSDYKNCAILTWEAVTKNTLARFDHRTQRTVNRNDCMEFFVATSVFRRAYRFSETEAAYYLYATISLKFFATHLHRICHDAMLN